MNEILILLKLKYNFREYKDFIRIDNSDEQLIGILTKNKCEDNLDLIRRWEVHWNKISVPYKRYKKKNRILIIKEYAL
jgi:hypothetical protein